MKNSIILILCILSLQSCIGPKKYAQYVHKAHERTDSAIAPSRPDVRITCDMPVLFNSLASVRKGAHYFIPAIFYWGTKETYHCELNPYAGCNIFSNTCLTYTDSASLSHVLKGRKLQISITSMPHRFTFSNVTDAIFVVFYGFEIVKQTIYPENDNLCVTYKLSQGDSIIKQANICINDFQRPLVNNKVSRKKITRQYMAGYEKNMQQLTTQCMNQLLRQL